MSTIRLTTKGRYATRILVYLASVNTGQPVRKGEIAAAEAISADYVEQILMRLKVAGLVHSVRGVRGGFRLAREPSTITVADVLAASEGGASSLPCDGDSGCTRMAHCVTRDVWRRADRLLGEYFTSVHIGDLARRAEEARGTVRATFEI